MWPQRKNKAFKCNEVQYDDQIKFHTNFYRDPIKFNQDALILKYTKGAKSKGKNPDVNSEVRNLAIKYYILIQWSKQWLITISYIYELDLKIITKYKTKYSMLKRSKWKKTILKWLLS